MFFYLEFLDYFFFFFQAEDGIRDFHVTGVQTCALPISRCQETASASTTLRLARSGSSRSSRKSSTNSSRERAKRKSSWPSPSGLPSLPDPSPPPSGRAMVSPSIYCLLPGNRCSRTPLPCARRNEGSCIPCVGSATSPPWSASLMLRFVALSCTALRISDFARRIKRCRFARFFPPGLRRRSTMYIADAYGSFFNLGSPSSGLFDAHVPLHQPADLTFGVATRDHALDEFAVLLLALAVFL